MSYKKLKIENPLVGSEKELLRVNLGGKSGIYGACSIEDFLPGISDLSLTHEAAAGFLGYPTSFTPANFWRKDGGVSVWMYEEAFDNWQDLYGMDAVKVFYHSGHGNMLEDGTYMAPMGAVWDDRSLALSSKMAFANEKLRYLFWSTCLSLRVHDGHSPDRTWRLANKGGLRMIFGYETVSYDSGRYGSEFWKQWKKGKSFSDAFIEASWSLFRNQTPVVCACGNTKEEVQKRLFSERMFYSGAVSSNWYWWKWREAQNHKGLKTARAKAPQNMDVLLLKPYIIDDDLMSAIANKVGINKRTAKSIAIGQDGLRCIGTKDILVSVDSSGTLQLQMAQANYLNDNRISEIQATKIARELIEDLGIAKDVKLTPATTYNSFLCGANTKTGEQGKPTVVETIIQFRQVNDKMESVNADSGFVAVAVDNDGKITRLTSSVKPIVDTQKSIDMQSLAKKREVKMKELSVEERFERKINRLINGTTNNSKLMKITDAPKVMVETLSDKIGYDFSSNYAQPVQQRDIEIKMGDFVKRYQLRVDL